MKTNRQFSTWSVLSIFLLTLVSSGQLRAATFASTQSGSWGSAATWGGAGVPGCGDTVTISGGNTVVEDANECSGDLTVNGTLDMHNQYFYFEGTTFTNNGALTSSAGNGEVDFYGVGGAFDTTQNLAGTGTYNTNGPVDFHTVDRTTVTPASGAVLNGLRYWTIDGASVLSLSNDFVVNGQTGSGQTTFYDNGAISSSGGTLKTHNNVTINGNATMSAPVEVVAGTTTANGNLGPTTVDNNATLTEGGTVYLNGDFTVASGGTLDMNNQYFYFEGTTFTNNGALTSSAGNGEVDFYGVGGAFDTTQNLAGTGTYNTNGPVDFHTVDRTTVTPASGAVLNGLRYWTIDGASVLSLSNDFVVNGQTGAGQTTFNNNSSDPGISGNGILKTHKNVTINSGGTISAPLEVVSDTTSASGNFGPITVDNGATLFQSASVAAFGDVTVASGGTLDMNNQYFYFEGTTFTNNGALTSSAGNGEVDFYGVGGAFDTTQNLAGTGTYNTNGPVDFHTVDRTTVTPASGAVLNGLRYWTIDGASVLSLSNDFVVNGQTGAGQTTFNNNSSDPGISGNGILKTHKNVTINSGGTISAPLEVVSDTTSASGNFGPITVDNGATLFQSASVAAFGDVTVASGGTLDMNNQYFYFEGTTFTNNGALISSNGYGEVEFYGVAGAFDTTQNLAGTGTYNTKGPVDFDTVDRTTVVSGNDTVVQGIRNNTIEGASTFDNNGTMEPGIPPGQANVSGNLQLGSTSNLSFEIGGTGQGTTYDLLNKIDNGTLTLNGMLTVRLINGFVPAISDVFTIVTTQQILAGSFSNVANGARLNTADGGGSFQVTYNVLNDPVDSRNVTLSDFQPTVQTQPELNGSGSIQRSKKSQAQFLIIDVEAEKEGPQEQTPWSYYEGTFVYSDSKSQLHFTSAMLTNVSMNANRATFGGIGQTTGKHPQSFTFTVIVTANQQPATNDTFSITTSTGYTASGNIVSGSITIAPSMEP